MRRIIVFLLALLLGLAQFAFVTIAHADNPVYITQVQITGGSGHTDQDFIELFNPGNEPANLKGYRLVKRTAQGTSDTLLRSWTQDAFIAPHHFYLWANSSFAGDIAANSSSTTTLSDNNGVAIRSGSDDTGLILDSVAWGTTNNTFRNVSAINMAANEGLYRINMYGADSTFEIKPAHARDISVVADPPTPAPATAPPCTITTLSPSPTTNTPNPNSTSSSTPTPPVSNQPSYDMSPHIKISEILPNPVGDDAGHEAVELVNTDTNPVKLEGWQLDDITTTGQPKTSAYQLSGTIAAGQFLTFTIPSGHFALNNSGDAVHLYFPDKTLAHQVQYDGSGKEGESYQNINGLWHWGEPSLGTENIQPQASVSELAVTTVATSAQPSSNNPPEPTPESTVGKVEGDTTVSLPEIVPKIVSKSPVQNKKSTSIKTAAKPTAKSASATVLEKSMDKKLTTLQDSLDNFEQESAQNFSSLSAAVQSAQPEPVLNGGNKPPAPRSIFNWIIFAGVTVLLGAGIGMKLFLSRRLVRQAATMK